MMIKNLKYMDIEYTNKDLDYIDYLCEIVEKNSEEIVNFFELEKYGEKTHVKLFDNLDDFRTYFKKCNNMELDWACGFAKDNNFYTLTLDQLKLVRTHENEDLEDLIKLILHEFVHTVHNRRFKYTEHNCHKWVSEGVAVYLSKQHENINAINCSYNQFITRNYYGYYKLLFQYILNKYGKNFIFELIDGKIISNDECQNLFDEAKEFYKKNIVENNQKLRK